MSCNTKNFVRKFNKRTLFLGIFSKPIKNMKNKNYYAVMTVPKSFGQKL